MHVVNVEDDSPLRDVLRIALTAAEPDIILSQFITGDDAVPYIQTHALEIDLFILDIRLPGYLNGLQVAAFVRAIHCPGFIVITSAYGTPNRDVLNTLRGEYLAKPRHIPQLTQKLFQYRLDKNDTQWEEIVAPPAQTANNRMQTVASSRTTAFVPATKAEPHKTNFQHVSHRSSSVGGVLQRIIAKMRAL